MTTQTAGSPARRFRAGAVAGFLFVHVAAAVGVVALGFSWPGAVLCLASYYLRMFAITAGFHRYFSHRAYRLARVPQFLLAFVGQTAAQKGVLWWASNHRHHHKYSDRPEDIHSPIQRGFWWSHIGWILSPDYVATDLSRVPDLAKYPELVWLDRHEYLPTALYGASLYLAFGWTGLFYGYFLSTVLLWLGERLGIVRGLHRPPRRWRDAAQEAIRTGRAFSSVRLHVRVQKLSLRWAEAREAVRSTAHDAFDELESARCRAIAQLEQLHAEAVAAGARAGERVEEIHREIERARAQLVQILERLVAMADSRGLPDPEPG
jgi:hypothetical protein